MSSDKERAKDYRKDVEKQTVISLNNVQNDDCDMGLFRQMLVCSGFLASDGGLSLLQLTMIPTLQTLGVPLLLVTSTGTASGLLALGTLSIMARIVDRGSNHRRRKKSALIAAAILYVLGFSLVITGCLVHILSFMNPVIEPNMTDSQYSTITPAPNETTLSKRLGRAFRKSSPLENCSRGPCVTTSSGLVDISNENMTAFAVSSDSVGPYIPLAGLLTMLGYVLCDTSNDSYNASMRSFCLTSAAKKNHSSLFITGVFMSGIGGCVVAIIGVCDVSVSFNGIDTNTVAVPMMTLIQNTVFLLLIVGCTFVSICAMPSFQHIDISPEKPVVADTNGNGLTGHKDYYGSIGNGLEKPNVFADVNRSPSGKHTPNTVYQPGHFSNCSKGYSSLDPAVTPPCITSYETKGSPVPLYSEQTYCRLDSAKQTSENIPFIKFFEKLNFAVMFVRTSTRGKKSFENTKNHSNEPSAECQNSNDGDPSSDNDTTYTEDPKENLLPNKGQLSKAGGGSSAGEHVHGRNNRFACCFGANDQSRKLFLLCTTLFFSAGAWQTYNITAADYLGKVVYDGDPDTGMNSQAYSDYQRGVRTASLGLLLLNVAYMGSSVLLRQFLANFSPKQKYTIVCGISTATLIIMLCTNSVVAFYIVSFMLGVFRSVMNTVPFTLANDVCQEASCQDAEGTAKVGSTMAIMSSMLSLSIIVVSSLEGPVLQATGDPRCPLYYTVVATASAAIVFAFF